MDGHKALEKRGRNGYTISTGPMQTQPRMNRCSHPPTEPGSLAYPDRTGGRCTPRLTSGRQRARWWGRLIWIVNGVVSTAGLNQTCFANCAGVALAAAVDSGDKDAYSIQSGAGSDSGV